MTVFCFHVAGQPSQVPPAIPDLQPEGAVLRAHVPDVTLDPLRQGHHGGAVTPKFLWTHSIYVVTAVSEQHTYSHSSTYVVTEAHM